jgi:hypothetical protein
MKVGLELFDSLASIFLFEVYLVEEYFGEGGVSDVK